MLFNQFLPVEELKKTFKEEEWDSLDYILDQFNSLLKEKKTSHVTTNLQLLGEIHHAANLDQYRKEKFRINLFEKLPPTEQQNFFKFSGIKEKISEMSYEKYKKSINEFIGFEWGDNRLTKKFIEYCGFPDYLIPDHRAEISVQEIVSGDKKNYQKEEFKPLKMIHGYQANIVYKTLKELEEPNCNCLIQMPTGTGKTRVGMEIISHILNEKQNVRIVWLAKQHELLEQAHDAFVETWNHVGKFPMNLANLWTVSSKKAIKLKIPKSKVLIFTTYDKLNNVLDGNVNLDADYIIVDEAHQIIAPTYNEAKDRITNVAEKETRVFGLTATPGRGIDQDQNIRLVSEFHNNIIKMEFTGDDAKMYKGKPVQYLEDQKVLSKTIPVKLPTEYEFELPENTWKFLSESSIKTGKGDKNEFTEETFKEMANDNIRNILIIRKLKELINTGKKELNNTGKKILYFSTDVKQSLLVFIVLQQIGINAIHVQSGIDPSFRRQIIKKFKDTNEIDVICNYNIFSTGFDVPNLDVVFIARPINSPVLFNQMVGRGTRGLKMGGTANHTLLQVIDKIPSRFSDFDPYEQFSYWDDVWGSN